MLVFDPQGRDKVVFDDNEVGRIAKWLKACDRFRGRELWPDAQYREYALVHKKPNRIEIPVTMYVFTRPMEVKND